LIFVFTFIFKQKKENIMISKTTLALGLSMIILNVQATIHPVPGAYSTIQAAINASANGDTIAVSPGSYFENINFRGKKVFLTSLYYLTGDTAYISSTIINGSTPNNPDTASCVLFHSGEDSTAVLQGFTITGGKGTKWTDIHGAGIFREGGGILMDLSSPTIMHNKIVNNTAINVTGVVSAGGGGLRIGDGNPIIRNNVISLNQGRYGAGIVLNYTGCRIRNNVISGNSGGQDYFGGSGIWIYNNYGSSPKIIENNTIINNAASASGGTGGILNWSAANVYLVNNILWANLPATQIKDLSSGLFVWIYNDVQGITPLSGNISQEPLLTAENYFLNAGSPCIDRGDSATEYNDIQDQANPGHALFPSKGLLRNDMGAYGGPYTSLLPSSQTLTVIPVIITDHQISIVPNPFSSETTVILNPAITNSSLSIFDESGKIVQGPLNFSGHQVKILRGSLASGVYSLRVTQGDTSIATGKLVIKD
jgi:hypothetical protein